MKRMLLILVSLLPVVSLFGQTPEKMSYQAVVRNAMGSLITNQPIGMQISILKDSTNGSAVYVETQNPTTNVNGLVSIEIGNGTVISGDFASIDWANGSYYVKSETDPNGGTNYTITGTTQLLSVPYALHAKTAGSVKKTGKKRMSLNVYAAYLEGASFADGFGRNAGIVLDTTSAQSFAFNFTVPDDYTKGDTIFVKMLVSASDTGHAYIFKSFVSVANPDSGFNQGAGASTGLYFHNPIVVTTPDTPISVGGYLISPDNSKEIQPGDGVSFGYFRFAGNPNDVNRGKVKIHSIYLEY